MLSQDDCSWGVLADDLDLSSFYPSLGFLFGDPVGRCFSVLSPLVCDDTLCIERCLI
jgi:hypothetical protein